MNEEDQRPSAYPDQSICTQCQHIGYPVTTTRGHLAIEIGLWLLFLLPGIIYSIWRLTSRYRACPCCGADAMIPVTSPRGAQLVQLTDPPPTWSGKFGSWIGRKIFKTQALFLAFLIPAAALMADSPRGTRRADAATHNPRHAGAGKQKKKPTHPRKARGAGARSPRHTSAI
jgi:hypothetical protein